MPDSDKLVEGRIIIDSYAWVEYFKGSDEGMKAKKIIEGESELFTPSIVIAELSDKYRREGITEWDIRNKFIKLRTKILSLYENILAHSLDVGARILTGNKHLKSLKNSIALGRS